MSEKILIIDTSTEACSAALLIDGKVTSQFEVAPRIHTKLILPMIDGLLQQAKLEVSALDAIAWGRGPGSFTGGRIGSGIMQGLALGSDKPVIPISTLAAMAQQAIEQHNAQYVMAAIDARMGEVYWGVFHNIDGIATLVGIEQVIAPEKLAQLQFEKSQYYAVGTAWQAYPQLLSLATIEPLEQILYPDAKYMTALALQQWQAGQAIDVEAAAPVYLRDTVTWKKLPGRE